MNTDELRTLLKEAGRPVTPQLDPVPAIHRRVRRLRRRQVTAAVAGTAVVAAGVIVAVDLTGSGAGHGVDAAGPTAEPPPGALDDTPPRVGDRLLVTDPPPRRALAAMPRGLYVGLEPQANDLIQVRWVCPQGTPANPVLLAVSVKFHDRPMSTPPTPPGEPVPDADTVECTSTIGTARTVVAGHPRYAVVQIDPAPSDNRQVKLEVATYR